MKTAGTAEPTIAHDLTPERTACPQCGRAMAADYANRRTLHTLAGVTRLDLTIRRCHHPTCAAHKRPYRPGAEGSFALPRHEFGLDVIALNRTPAVRRAPVRTRDPRSPRRPQGVGVRADRHQPPGSLRRTAGHGGR